MSNKQTIELLLLALLAAASLLLLSVTLYKRKVRERQKDAVFLNKKEKKNHLYAAYKRLSKTALTKNYLLRLKRRYEIIHPKDIRKSGEMAMRTAIRVWALGGALTVVTLLMGLSVYLILVTATLIYLMSSYITFTSVKKSEKQLLLQFEGFLGTIRHHYYQTNRIDDAIYDALGELEEPVGVHAQMIHDVLTSDDVEEAAARYNDVVPNRFIKTFVSLCILITRFGDRTVDGQSLFLQNLTYLKEEINIELRKREKIDHKFKGLVFVTVVPMYFLPAIEGWAIGNVPELYTYYHGAYGIIVSVAICTISLVTYNVLIYMSDNGEMQIRDHAVLDRIAQAPPIRRILNSHINRRYTKAMQTNDTLRRMGETMTVKQFILKRAAYSTATFCLGLLLVAGIHATNKNNAVNYTDNLVNISSSASDKEVAAIQEEVRRLTGELRGNRKLTQKQIEDELFRSGMIKNKQLMTLTAGEILKRVNRYQSEYIKWYEIVALLTAAAAAYQTPHWMLLYRKKIMQMNMEDEVIQYHSIILMLMYIERISARDILEWMEQFAVFFRTSIEECLNNYTFGELEALEELRENEPFEPFRRVVDNLIMCDKIGMKAFREVAVERRNFQEKRKLENEILIDNRASIGQFLSFIPLFTAIGLYLIVPFVVEGVNQLSFYFSQIEL